MNIAITGSSGFIGSHLIKILQGHHITEIDLISQRIEDINFIGIDTVVHLAALVHQMKGVPEESYFRINTDLTILAARKAKEQGVGHFIFMSTAKVFGESTSNLSRWNEDSACYPQDAYGESKFQAEKQLMKLICPSYKIAIIRSPLVYGPGVKANMFNLIKLIDTFPALPLKGIGNKRSFVYIENLTALIKSLIENKSEGIFIAGDVRSLSTSELAQLISDKLNKKTYLFASPKLLLTFFRKIKPSIYERLYGSLELDNTFTNKKLNFNVPYSTSYGIEQMVKWYTSSKKIKLQI